MALLQPEAAFDQLWIHLPSAQATTRTGINDENVCDQIEIN